MPGPLAHIRVLDLSRVLAGPWASQNLADLGAEVIKVERPGAGDDSRAFGPPWVRDREGRDTRDSAYFTSANRGKKSITVNVAGAEGQAIVRSLAGKSDVLLENYKHGDLARYGLGYEDLKKINPSIIYAYSLGYARKGPYGHKPAFDDLVQGVSGAASLQSRVDGHPPRFMPSLIALAGRTKARRACLGATAGATASKCGAAWGIWPATCDCTSRCWAASFSTSSIRSGQTSAIVCPVRGWSSGWRWI